MTKKRIKRTKQKKIKDLHLDKDTSHGGWPGGHKGSWNDKTPVRIQIKNWLDKMGLLDNPDHAVLSEVQIRDLIKNLIVESYNYKY